MPDGGGARGGAPGRRLLLLGVSVRALAASVAASRLAAGSFPAGVLALDYFGDADLQGRRRPRSFMILSLPRDLGRPRSVLALARAALDLDWDDLVYAGGLENRPRLLRRLEARGGILGNGPASVERVRDPAVLFPFLRRLGLPHAATWAGGAGPPRKAGLRSLWKPLRSGGGAGVREAKAREIRPRGHYRQELLRGAVGSVAFLADGAGAVLLGASEQIVGWSELGGSGFRYGGSIAGPPGALLTPGALALLAEAATAITSRFCLRGLNGLDFVLVGDQPRLIEVNPRYTASMELIEELAGQNLFDLHLGAIAGGPLPDGPLPSVRRGIAPEADEGARGPFLAKGILYADRPVRAGAPEALFALGCRDVPVRGELFAPGQTICTLMARGPSPAACRSRLAALAARARRRLSSAETLRRQGLPAHGVTW